MNDKLIVDRDIVNRIHAIAKQGQYSRSAKVTVECFQAIQTMCLGVLTNAFEKGTCKLTSEESDE